MIWVLLWLLLLPPSLPRVAIDIDIDLWADAPRCGRPEWSSITCTLCFSGRWFTRDLGRDVRRGDGIAWVYLRTKIDCKHVHIYIYNHIYIYCIYIYVSLSLSPCLFGLFGCCCVQVCAIHIVCMDTYIHVQSCILYIYMCIYIYV